MKNFKLSFVFFVVVFFSACSIFEPEIKEINSIKEVKSVFEHATKNDLFVFDAGDVIFEPVELVKQTRFCNNSEVKKIVDDFNAFIRAKPNYEAFKNFISKKFALESKIQPIEQELINNIRELQKKKIKTLILTAMPPGKSKLMESTEEKRLFDGLLSFDLDFSQSFSEQQIMLAQLEKSEINSSGSVIEEKPLYPALFYMGIICTGNRAKGVILKTFLEKIKYIPLNIYFFDDKLKNVESVVQEMKKIGINCYGFVYKAATVNRSDTDLDIQVVRLQYNLIKQREDFVSYAEARKILKK